MTFGRLRLHIGSLKTGTTAIQTTLHLDRARLAEAGVHYPATSPEFSPTRSNHNRIAHAVASGTLRNRIGLALYCRRLRRQAHRFDLTLMSAEPVYRHVLGRSVPTNEDAWFAAHEAYLRRLRDYLRGFELEIVVYFRRPADYAVSLYKEMVSKARTGPMPDFLSTTQRFGPHFAYPRHVAVLRAVFDRVETLGYENESARGLIAGFYERFGVSPPQIQRERVRSSLSNRAVAWICNRAGEGSKAAQRERVLYAARDPDGLFADPEPSTLWPSVAAHDAFIDRYRDSYRLDFVGDPPPMTAAPVVWTAAMQAEADAAFLDWRAANLPMLRVREAQGLRHFHP